MGKDKIKKLNKAAIATVLAASGVLVAIPQPTNAYMFKDLNPNADYYKPVLDLYNRGVVNGFEDGTFRPHNEVTRGQAAKMLTLALGLNTKNQSDPKFKDVPRNNPYYIYIATLANAGIINGYSDRTFKPNEPITRGQMSKIITIGYKLGVSTKIKDHFIDVTSKTSNAFYIQTLYDLGITKGKTANTFEPFSTVTRAQLATFIWRAERADKGNPSYIIGDIKGDLVHINGVQYTIQPALRSIINESNAAILKGAEIDGTFNGKILSSVSKLTINASGTSNRLLALDGGHTSFGGELVINSSYVRLKNWTLTGRVTIAETPRKSLATYTERLKNLNIASISGFGFIDWDKPTEDDDDYLNPDEDETLKPDKDPTKPDKNYTARMAKVERYIDFENTYVSNLIVEQTGTFISSDTTLSRVTIARDVENVEIYADMTTLYLEGDRNLKIYGVHDIETVYKNNYKSTYFNTDSYIDFLYVDNSFGWIDIGEFVYIGKVIIPKDKTPNDIFDDYYNDNDNIGNIVDPDDKPVDRDPIEDQETPDETRPVITGLKVKGEGTSATATFTSNEDGTYYYAVREASQRPPTIREILQENKEKRGTATAGKPVTFTINDLKENTEYVLYLVVVDKAENISDKMEAEFETTDGTAPRVINLEAEALHGGQRAKITFKPSEPGDYYYYVRYASSTPAPTTEFIVANYTGKGYASSKDTVEDIITNLEPNRDYEIYVVMKDDSGILSTDPAAKAVVKTSSLDTEHPFVVGSAPNRDKDLVPHPTKPNQFYIYFSEKLDPKTANDTQNYDLSGTVIINTTGQEKIKPSAVQYEENGGRPRVLLTIPSQTGFVNGDTLKVTVLPGVKDLADLEFENVNTVKPGVSPNNFAEYTHNDQLLPQLTIENVIRKPDETDGRLKVEVEYKPNKAGTYYYMVIPEQIAVDGEIKKFEDLDIDELDFVNEFDSDPSKHSGEFIVNGVPIYIHKEGPKPATLENKTSKFDITLSKESLNPFLSYKVHMVLKDRSGKLSKIASKQMISDTEAPLISGLSVEPKPGDDTKATVTLSTDEKTTLYYWKVPKKLPDGTENSDANLTEANSDYIRTKLLDSQKVTIDAAGANIQRELTGFTPHTDYVIYFGAEDTYGNFTILGKNPAGDSPARVGLMKEDHYADGTAPTVEDIIYRNLDGTFTITFSEAIMRQQGTNVSSIPTTGPFNLSTIMNITDENDTPITSQYNFVSYTVGANTTDKSKLVIKPNNSLNADKTFTVKMKDKPDVYDYQDQNAFDLEDFGKYVYPHVNHRLNTLTYAQLTGTIGGNTAEWNSRTMNVSVNIGASVELDQTYYYAVVDENAADPTVKDIITTVKNNKPVTGSPIILYGSGPIEGSQGTSSILELVANPSTTPGQVNVFKTGQRVYLFTIDKYGNVIHAIEKRNPIDLNAPKYVIITK